MEIAEVRLYLNITGKIDEVDLNDYNFYDGNFIISLHGDNRENFHTDRIRIVKIASEDKMYSSYWLSFRLPSSTKRGIWLTLDPESINFIQVE